ncbi:MAG TPA: N-acetyl-gamma-glutamyl-phosphate reductase [Polyangiaceae bacterium]|nr:N-acetyl-gamma-glutamyl-phosphate reductase [Polyangiaceae bacterium]
MRDFRVGVVGASGYSGSVAVRLLATHPRAQLSFATSDRWSGESVGPHLGVRLGADLRFVPNSAAIECTEKCDAVVLATSAEVSVRLLPAFAERGKQVIDLSGAFRLTADAYPHWYGFEHDAPQWLERAHYGLPELFGPPTPASPVSNPGCFPTAALLAIGPLVRAGLAHPEGIVIDAKSGVTGAGRQSGETYSFAEVDDDFHAYSVLSHKHTPEIHRGLSRLSRGVSVTFTAHLLPVRRGLLATCYARPREGATPERVAECLADTYAKSAFVRALAPNRIGLRGVVGTNECHVGATADDKVVIAIGAIDNLLKGAAGQAIQNLNLMNGWHEASGLDGLQRVAP